MAAERHPRACYGMEVDRLYCDVILAQWERFSWNVRARVAGDPQRSQGS